jgi:hypothetical protein
VLGFCAVNTALIIFLFMSIPKAWSLGSYHIASFKLPIGILTCFIVLTGIIRVFAVRPQIVKKFKLTFALVSHYDDGDLNVELMEYKPNENVVREYV